ncbi:MAG TPA: ABC transporter permease [Rhodocyclaceae bacterium]|nr:ABC transporter permease [Rhodocyclaceae bacterium]
MSVALRARTGQLLSRRRPRRLDRRLISVISVGTVLLAWVVCSLIGVLNPNKLPPVQDIAQAFWSLVIHGYEGVPLWEEILASLARALAGFLLAVLVGVPFGLLIGESEVLAAIFTPFLGFLRPIPPIALIPLFIFYFGIGEISKVVLIFITAFWYITLSAASGVQAVSKDLVLAARTLGFNKRQVFRHVILPSALPQILTGMRVAMALCWALVVAAELIAAQVGLGYMIMDATTFFRIPVVYVGVGIIGIIGLVLERSLVWLEKRLLHWQGR